MDEESGFLCRGEVNNNIRVIYPVIGVGQVATATLALDPSDRLELAENKSRQETDRRWTAGKV